MKRLVLLFAAGSIMLTATDVRGQEAISLRNSKKTLPSDNKRELTIGFKTGGQVYFMAPVLYKAKPSFSTTNQVFVRKHINEHIAIETGISYYKTPIGLPPGIATDGIPFKSRTCTISIPASVQYYLLPQKKVHPYVGLGGVYSINTQNGNYPSSETDTKKCCLVNGTKYVSLLVTQGIIYEVNTKIQLSESVHFIPNNDNNIIGIDLGIGYKL